jgi:tRNA-2-methylthio-N6-dimethylallyladenosine synthase
MNVADTERARDRLRVAGYRITSSEKDADVVLFNTCSIRERAAQKVFNRVGQVRRARVGTLPIIGLMGCVAQLEGTSIFDHTPSIDMVVGTRATDRLPELIERVQAGERAFDLDERGEEDTWIVSSVARHSPYIAYVPIIEGCNKFCSYCIVPYSRGREKSRIASEIVSDIQNLRKEGFREVHLIGQNVNSYRPRSSEGLESVTGATPFSRLLRAIARTGMNRIKFTTSFPRDFHSDIVAALDEYDNLCNWVHLPVQSGNDRVLKLMRRGYSAATYLKCVDAIKNSRRQIAITSDVIVGFPGETVSEFEDTMRLVERCEYDGLYMFNYSERPGTPSALLLDDVSKDEKKRRFLELEIAQRKIQRTLYENYIGREVEVLVERESTKSPEDMTGHSTCQKVVNFRGGQHLSGQIARVRITKAKTNSLYGELVSSEARQ